MSVEWVIEQPKSDGTCDSSKLIPVLESKGIKYHTVNYIPFENDNDRRDRWVSNLPFKFIPYGSINLVKSLSRIFYARCMAFCDWDIFKCSYYYLRYGTDIMFNGKFRLCSLGKIEMTEDESYFIRPDDNDKKFTGQVVSGLNFYGFRDFVYNYGCNENTQVLLCPSKKLEGLEEYRLIMKGKDFITGSLYSVDDEHTENPEVSPIVIKSALQFVKRWVPPFPIYVLDIALHNHTKCTVLEIGCVNMAGLYACDCNKLVDAIQTL